MSEPVIGVIGGSGIYGIDGLEQIKEMRVDTPFGEPSDALLTGRLAGRKMVFLARHGRGHRVLPHEINYRANMFAMKKLGVQWLLSLSAVGSMKEGIRPGDVVIVDQFFDRTRGRASTFFGRGLAAHVSLADPVSPTLSALLYETAAEVVAERDAGERVHRNGTYLVIDGPQFSTRAESHIYRSWGVDVIGMTNMPEARLAREAEMSYATLALVTDYDCWHRDEDAVSVEGVLATMAKNGELARQVVARVAPVIPAQHDCIAARALENAFITDRAAIPEAVRRELEPILGDYLS